MNLEILVVDKHGDTLYGWDNPEPFLHTYTIEELQHIFSRQIMLSEIKLMHSNDSVIFVRIRKADR